VDIIKKETITLLNGIAYNVSYGIKDIKKPKVTITSSIDVRVKLQISYDVGKTDIIMLVSKYIISRINGTRVTLRGDIELRRDGRYKINLRRKKGKGNEKVVGLCLNPIMEQK